ncbi:MAG: lmo0937 family membrane protein [Planctomycetes bacterium]|nr:lmo0937 family membrane protein [Planctomycetota bacterium]
MLYPIVVVLLLLWALGMVSSFTLGGLLHLLLVVVVVLLVVRLLAGRGAATM